MALLNKKILLPLAVGFLICVIVSTIMFFVFSRDAGTANTSDVKKTTTTFITTSIIQTTSLRPSQFSSIRRNDLATFQNAIQRYINESPSNQKLRGLEDFDGYKNMSSDLNSCPEGAIGKNLNTVKKAVTLENKSGENMINLQLLIKLGYLPKISLDPQTNTPYRACLDISTKFPKFVIYSSVIEDNQETLFAVI